MDSGEISKTEAEGKAKSVTVETLGMILGSAVLGAAAAFSILRAMERGLETISTTGLLSFLFMLGLCISATVLSVVAIALSRSAERAIARKSEEMSALQAGMVARTVAAIERMESSVRQVGDQIADAIYDNFEGLAEEIQESLPPCDMPRADVPPPKEAPFAEPVPAADLLRAEEVLPVEGALFQESEMVVQEAPFAGEEEPVPPLPEPVSDEMRTAADKKYGEFKDIVLLGVANYPGVVARKIGEGHYRTEGDELVDGAFVIQNETVAVCTFCTNRAIVGRFLGETGDSFNGFLKSFFNELKNGRFTRIFLVFDGQLTNTSPYAKALNGLSNSIDADTFSRFELFEGTPDVVIPELTERVSQLMEAAAETSAGEIPEMSFRRQASA